MDPPEKNQTKSHLEISIKIEQYHWQKLFLVSGPGKSGPRKSPWYPRHCHPASQHAWATSTVLLSQFLLKYCRIIFPLFEAHGRKAVSWLVKYLWPGIKNKRRCFASRLYHIPKSAGLAYNIRRSWRLSGTICTQAKATRPSLRSESLSDDGIPHVLNQLMP